jgi:hypothetical protein
MKNDEIEAWKQARLEYFSYIPLYANGGDIPECPEPPEWLQIEQE